MTRKRSRSGAGQLLDGLARANCQASRPERAAPGSGRNSPHPVRETCGSGWRRVRPADLRDPAKLDAGPEFLRGVPEAEDPTAILILAPVNKPFRLEVVPGGLLVGSGATQIEALMPGQASFQDVEVPLPWSLP
jgi:hypothetical protein